MGLGILTGGLLPFWNLFNLLGAFGSKGSLAIRRVEREDCINQPKLYSNNKDSNPNSTPDDNKSPNSQNNIDIENLNSNGAIFDGKCCP